MSTIMTIQGKQFTISDETDISENMYDDKNKVMRIVIHDTNDDLHHLIIAAQLNMKEIGTVTFEQKGNTLTLHNPSVLRRTHMEGIPDGFFKYCYIYELESKEFKLTPVIHLGNDLLVQRLNEYAKLPTRSHRTDAGLDLYSIEDVEIEAFTLAKIHTGIAIQLPDNTYGQITDRSSMGSKSIHVFGGVIDHGYRGEIVVLLYNADQDVHVISKGDKIAQLIIINIQHSTVMEVDSLDNSPRNKKGFGSTGK